MPDTTTTTTSTATTTTPRTTIPARGSADRRPPRPRELSVLRAGYVLSLLGAFAAALATTALLWTQVGPFTGILGFIVVAWLLFVAYYAVLISFDEDRPTMRD